MLPIDSTLNFGPSQTFLHFFWVIILWPSCSYFGSHSHYWCRRSNQKQGLYCQCKYKYYRQRSPNMDKFLSKYQCSTIIVIIPVSPNLFMILLAVTLWVRTLGVQAITLIMQQTPRFCTSEIMLCTFCLNKSIIGLFFFDWFQSWVTRVPV